MMRSSIASLFRRSDVVAILVLILVSALAVALMIPRSHHATASAGTSASKSESRNTPSPTPTAAKSSSASSDSKSDPQSLILVKLRPFLNSFFTVTATDTVQSREARIAKLAPSSVFDVAQTSFPGIPVGSVMKPLLSSDDNVQFQTPKGQMYVSYPVTVQLTTGNVTRTLTFLTGSVWALSGQQWLLTHFAFNPNGVMKP